MAATATRPTPQQQTSKQNLKRLQRKAANDDFYNAQNATNIAPPQPPSDTTQRIQQQYANNPEMQNARMLQANQRAANDNRYTRPKKLSPRKKNKLAEKIKIIDNFEKDSYIPAYAMAILVDIFDLLVGIFTMYFTSVLFAYEKAREVAGVVDTIGDITSVVVGFFTAGTGFFVVQAIKEGLQYFGGLAAEAAATAYINSLLLPVLVFFFLAFILRIYVGIFIWKRTTFLSRKILKFIITLVKGAIPVINLLPLTTIRLRLVQNKDRERYNDAVAFVRKYKKKM